MAVGPEHVDALLDELLAPVLEIKADIVASKPDHIDGVFDWDEAITAAVTFGWNETTATLRRHLVALLNRKPDASRAVEDLRAMFWRTGVDQARKSVKKGGRAQRLANDVEPGTLTEAQQKKIATVTREAAQLAAHSRMDFAFAGALDCMLAKYGGLSNAYQDDKGPTVHALMQPKRIEPMAQMLRDGVIQFDQYTAGREIEWIVRSVTSETDARASRIVSAGRPPKHSGRVSPDMPEAAAVLHSAVYRPWAAAMGDAELRVFLRVVVWGDPAPAHGGKLAPGFVTMLRQGLERYIAIRSAAAGRV